MDPTVPAPEPPALPAQLPPTPPDFRKAGFWRRVLALLIDWIILAIGAAIFYLIAFNAKTRQSVHDLVVGSYVVRLGSETVDKPKIWGGHYAVVALILVLAGLGPVLLTNVIKEWVTNEMIGAY